ncbi:hypothetical protein O2N63_04930 [Aliiroseovarius sp. KMU-50]|uniref:Phage tail protein n=1 Tax=Aliiroseovarius salicola TaxID=3009082 RepID=A0ABT4VYU3_9RHOB|nr:hypothetical protein [Aliiroseovarius sp. KMU-50]MDA5093427.1 hypothetical protein [Aliiroseovarius sp. KMU-50]
MPFPISPGVFVQERHRPPEWQSKGAVLFIGPFPKGPVGMLISVENATQLEEVFGDNAPQARSPHVTLTALRTFFDQGGRSALVLRLAVGSARPKPLGAEMLVTAAGEVELIETAGPDPVQPGDPGWVEHVEKSFARGDDLKGLQNLTLGQAELVAAPILASVAPRAAGEVYRKLHSLCLSQDMFLLLDPPELSPGSGLENGWFGRFRLGNSVNAIALAPLLQPINGTGTPMPPSGAVAGLLDRLARRRGVWSSPAGEQACLNDLSPVEATDQEVHAGVNRLCSRPEGAGFSDDGVYTRAGKDMPRLRHLRVLRKTRLTLRRELARLMDVTPAASHCSEARLIAEALMVQLWQDGALRGRRQAQAFRVRTTEPDVKTGAFELCVGLALQEPGRFLWESLTLEKGQTR